MIASRRIVAWFLATLGLLAPGCQSMTLDPDLYPRRSPNPEHPDRYLERLDHERRQLADVPKKP